MFETAVVRSRAVDRRMSWLTLSLAIHSAAIAAVLMASLASVRLPEQAPKQMMPFILPSVTPPPALGTPNARPAPPRPRPSTAPLPRVPVAPIPNVAPNIIPNTVQPVSDQPANPGPETPGLEIGSDIGVGTQPSTSTQIAPDANGPLMPGNGVIAPRVIRRVEPLYPPLALRAKIPGTVVLQCIIDKSGRIRDVRVAASTFGAFDQPAIDAVQQWLFAPGTMNGQPVDTIFELTVKFQVR